MKECFGLILGACAQVTLGYVYYKSILPLYVKNSNRSLSKSNLPKLRLYALGLAMVSAIVLSKLIGFPSSALEAFWRAAVCGAALCGAALYHNYLFTNTNVVVMLLDTTFHTISAGVMGVCCYWTHANELLAVK
jgi:hypothetical protein